MRRLLVVFNRLPYTLRASDGQANLAPSTGGLATGMRLLLGRGLATWVGGHGLALRTLRTRRGYEFILAAGDLQYGEDLFASPLSSSVTIRVGGGPVTTYNDSSKLLAVLRATAGG